MIFDSDDRAELLIEEEDRRLEESERALHEPRDDDHTQACPVCRAADNRRCCEFGRDR